MSSSSRLIGRIQCPKCASENQDISKDNLGVYDDGHVHCYSCSYTSNVTREKIDINNLPKSDSKPRERSVDVLEVDSLAGYDSSVMRKFGINLGLGNQSGYYLKFPYYDIKGNLIAYKLREYNPVTKTLERNIYFEYIEHGVGKIFPCFNYQQAIQAKASTLLVFEGETDLLKFVERYGVPEGFAVVALSGVNTAVLVTDQFLKNAPQYVNYIFLLDNDSAGEEGYANLLTLVPNHPQVNLCRTAVNFRECKDIKELITNHPDTSVNEILSVSPIRSKGNAVNIVKRNSLDILSSYYDRIKTPIIDLSQYLPTLAKSWLPRKGNVFVVTGGSGKGKSFFLEWLVVKMLCQGKKVLLFSLEMSEDDVIVRLVNRMCGVNILVNPLHTLDETLLGIVKQATDIIDANLYLAEINGAVSPQVIRDTLSSLPEFMDAVVVDTFTNLAESLAWDSLEMLAKELKDIAVSKVFNEPMFLLVSQVSAPEGNDDYFLPKASDLRGGKGLLHYASCVIAFSYSPSRNKSFLKVVKLDRIQGAVNPHCDLQLSYINGDFHEDTQTQGTIPGQTEKTEANTDEFEY